MVKFIDDHRGAHGVEPICEMLPIAPATYYDHQAKRADPAAVSFFWRLTNGFTYAGEISRTSCPSFPISRPQKWAPPQASIATEVVPRNWTVC